MKRIFTLSLVVLMTLCYNVKGQSVRLVLAEEFTQASCPPCATQNPGFNNLLNANPTKVVAVKYQTSWPGFDPMNQNTESSIVGPRLNNLYPFINGVPYSLMDGDTMLIQATSYTGAPAQWTQNKLNTRQAVASPYDLTVTHQISAGYDSIFVTISINATMAVTGNLVAHAAVIEREINFCTPPGSNGETDFEGVVEMMLPSVSGTALAGSWTVGQTQTITLAAKLASYIYDKNHLAVVAFIQDNTTHEVHQAAYSAPVPLTVDAKLGCGGTFPAYICGTSTTPNITIENAGSTNLTTASIDWTVDGVAQTPIAWTGNLATGATDNVAVPAVPSAAGLRQLSFTVTTPNGQADLNTGLDTYDASFLDYGLIGAPPAVEEKFVVTTFPPGPMWRNVNPNAGAGWTRSTTSGGSARMYFWGSANGQIDELWLPNVDLTAAGTTTANLDFDLAACQYQTSNDRMEVLYSIDCGVNWISVFNEAGATLAAGNPAAATSWTPTAAQWHHKTLNLSGAIGQSSVIVKFKATSNNGNNCYIDNINFNTNLATAVPTLAGNSQFNVYPNPSNGLVNVQLNFEKNENVTIVITNSLGAIVKTVNVENVMSDVIPVDLSQEAKGTYIVTVKTATEVATKRVTITE